MRIIDGFRLRTIAGQAMIIGEGLRQVDFNKVIYLNGSAAVLWESVIGKDFTDEDLAHILMSKYDVGHEQALTDAREIASQWLENGLIAD